MVPIRFFFRSSLFLLQSKSLIDLALFTSLGEKLAQLIYHPQESISVGGYSQKYIVLFKLIHCISYCLTPTHHFVVTLFMVLKVCCCCIMALHCMTLMTAFSSVKSESTCSFFDNFVSCYSLYNSVAY